MLIHLGKDYKLLLILDFQKIVIWEKLKEIQMPNKQ